MITPRFHVDAMTDLFLCLLRWFPLAGSKGNTVRLQS
jgi:hypothetical protein